MDELRELAVRAALFAHLDALQANSPDQTLRWDQTESFEFDSERYLIRQVRGRGIAKPAALDGALTITTAFTPFGQRPPYEDLVGADGFARYHYEGTDGDLYTNRALRLCGTYALPLAYFVGVRRGYYRVHYPTYVIGEDTNSCTFTLAFERGASADDPGDELERRYRTQMTRARLHQPIFRERVLHAYGSACAVCHLRHAELLDAAHIVEDSASLGEPIVPNGIALCKIHHAAYDRDLMGVTPDYVVEINEALRREVDGPMLTHGLKEMHGERLRLPSRRVDHPDAQRLAIRYERFVAAS